MDLALADRLRAARTLSGLSARDVARLAHVDPSTVLRVENGAWNKVSYDVVLRLLEANDLGPDLRPLSRPTAIASARRLLGDDIPAPADFDEWVDRWQRLRLVKGHDVVDFRGLAFRAGRSAALGNRPQSVDLLRPDSWVEAGRLLAAADLEWANTGDAAANRLAMYADQTWPVFYVSDLRTAVEALGAPARLPGEVGPRLTLIAFDAMSEVGRWQEPADGMWFASPWQVVMDCFAGTNRMPLQAEWILERWEAADSL